MDTRDPLDVRWETAEPTASSRPMDTLSLDIAMQPSAYPTDRRRAMLYYLEHHRAANNSILLDVDRDAFLEALGEGTEPTRELLQGAVRAFLCAALRHPDAQTYEGWHKITTTCCTMLGTAISLGYAEARPIVSGRNPVPRIPATPPLPPWAIMGYESRRPTPNELEADLAYWKGLPVRLVEVLI